jgi:tetratricopeptide (TPR) repeat protein
VAHGLVGATTIYGFYTPRNLPLPWHTSPFVNPNNLAGYLNLAALCGVGVLLSRRPLLPRAAVALGVATIVAVGVISASRGGFLTLPVGLVALAVMLRFRSDLNEKSSPVRSSARGVLLMVGAALAAGAVLAVLGGTRETWAELYDKNLSKVRMLAWAKPMIANHFWLGVGRGAFESVFPAYRTDSGSVLYTHPENFPAQWMTEWGMPVAIVAMLCLAWWLRPGLLPKTSTVSTAMFVGIGVLLLQNLFDLGIEVPGVAVALAATIGGLAGANLRARERRSSTESTLSSSAVRRLRAGIIAASVAILAIAIGPLEALRDATSERDDLHSRVSAWINKRLPAERIALRRDLRKAMLRHPAEPYFPLLYAELAWAAHDEGPFPGIGRSLERASVNGGAHLLLAQVLVADKRMPQARLELRLATHDDAQLVYAAAPLAVRASSGIGELLETIADGRDGVPMLKTVVGRLDIGDRLELLKELTRRTPADTFAYEQMAEIYLGEMSKGDDSPLCAGDRARGCEEAVAHAADTLHLLLPSASTAARLRASLLAARGKAEQAERLLAGRCREVDDPLTCLTARAYLAANLKDNTLHKVDEELIQIACRGYPPQCAQSSTTMGDLFAARGEWGTALGHYDRSAKQEPTEGRWFRVADAAAQVGAHSQAADALEKVARLRGGAPDETLRARIRAERGHALGQLYGP